MKSSKNSVAALILPTLYGLFFAALPLFVILPGTLRSARANSDVRAWPEVLCTVVESSVRERGAAAYELSVKYKYVVDGHVYTSSGVTLSGDYAFKKVAERLPLLEKYAKGRSAVCRVNPAAPGKAVLMPPKAVANIVPIGIMLLFVSVGLAIAVSPWVSLAAKRQRERVPRPLPEAPDRSGDRAGAKDFVLSVAGGVFLTVGLAVAAGMTRKNIRYMGCSRWPQVEGTVLRCDLQRSHSSKGGTSYGVYTAYAYTVDGVRYENDKDSLADYNSNLPWHYENFREKVASRPAGSKVTVYADPSDPATSLLDPSFPWDGLGFLMIPAVFVAVGGMGFFTGLRRIRGMRRARAPRVQSGTTRLSTPFQECPFGKIKRTRTFLPGVFFALVWNAFASCGLLPCIPHFVRLSRNGGTGVSMKSVPAVVLMLVFPAVGVVLAVLAVREIAREVLNPHLEIRQIGGAFRSGMEAQMEYRLDRNAEKVREFGIRIVGYMKVSAGGGRNRSVVEREFFSREVCRARTPTRFAQGFFTCSPEKNPDENDFDGDACGPHWKLEVNGKLRSGGAWTDSYPLS